jgi:rhamnulokinase
MPGEEIGKLRSELLEQPFGYDIPVIAIAGHDTASAVASVPAANEKFAYLSSGTWSLMGIEVKDPIITDRSAELNFTNEGGIEGTTRFLKNITGMWILEQCRKEWKAAGKDYSYPELVEMELSAPAFHSFFNTDDPIFANPPSMLAAIDEYCEKHGIAKPENDAQVARSIMESLALRYRTVFTWLKEVAPFPINVLHIIGGGAKNALLDQFTANAIGATVLAGPTEATAIGNIMMQFKAIGLVKDIREMRALIAKATPLDRFEPKETEAWDKAYAEFCKKCY